jgi:1-acyl-sn-glycerol-3-phosphate acyltransferase
VSWLDIYTVNAWRPTPFVSKAEVRQWPVVGWLAEKLDTVFIAAREAHRGDARHARNGRAAAQRRRDVRVPGGHHVGRAGLLPFHANLFQAAVSAGCAVQPICLMYEDAQGRQSVTPAYTGELALGKSLDMVLRGGPLVAHLYVCEPIAPGGDRRATSAAARDAIAAALEAMQAQVGKPSPEALAELERHAYPVSEVGAAAAGDATAEEPVPGREG